MSSTKVLGRDRSDYPLPRFYDEIYKLVDDPSTDSIISWSESNNGFIIRDQEKLISSKFYSGLYCRTFDMFISFLEKYGFVEIERSDGLREFGDKNFVRGRPVLMTEMHIKVVTKFFAKSKSRNPVVPRTVQTSFIDYDPESDEFKQYVSECIDVFGL